MFSSFLINLKKSILQFIKEHTFQKISITKSSHSAGQNWMSKIQSFSYLICKVNTIKISKKFRKQNLSKNNEKMALSISWSFLHALGITALTIKKLSVCFFIFQTFMCMEKIKRMFFGHFYMSRGIPRWTSKDCPFVSLFSGCLSVWKNSKMISVYSL